MAVLSPRRETARLRPPHCFGERLGHRAIQTRLASPFPPVSLEHPQGFVVGWCHGAIGSLLLRPSKWLAPPGLTDRDAPRHQAAGTVHPSLPPRQSPAPGVGYDYGAELRNCAGGSFPRKNGQRYRLHLDFHQLDSYERFRSAHMTSPSPRLGLARAPQVFKTRGGIAIS